MQNNPNKHPLSSMNKQTQAIHTAFQRRDSYGALSMPVYHTAAYEFDSAADMADAFCGSTAAPCISATRNWSACLSAAPSWL